MHPRHLAGQHKSGSGVPSSNKLQRAGTKLQLRFQVSITANNVLWRNPVDLPQRGPVTIFAVTQSDSPRPAMNASAALHIWSPIWRCHALADCDRMLKTAVGLSVFRHKAHNENIIAAIGPLMDRNHFLAHVHRFPFALHVRMRALWATRRSHSRPIRACRNLQFQCAHGTPRGSLALWCRRAGL